MAMYNFNTESMTEYYVAQKQKHLKILDDLETNMRNYPEDLNFLDGIYIGTLRGKIFVIDNILTDLQDFAKLGK